MGDIALPESVKIARAGLPLALTLEGLPFPVNLGQNEVMVLLSLYYTFEITVTVGFCTTRFGLWRKTDTNPAAMQTDHTDMIWETGDARVYVNESTESSDREHVIFPWPLILIRPPRLVGLRIQADASHVDMRLYYLIQKVSDEKLAELMVKDHA